MAEFVRVERDGAIATIRLDRPPMNALSTQVQDEIAAAAGEAGADPAICAVVVYGGGKVFAAGADIKELASASYPQMPRQPAPGRPPSRRSRRSPSRWWRR
jgi:Enoyl-CoA hydratase/carnithine racemase